MLEKTIPMDPAQQSAADYYQKHRKHSMFSRITIISSMAILLIVLAFNINALYAQDKSTNQSHASTPQDIESMLPSLPAGCQYEHAGEKFKVTCQATPTISITANINVTLPELPPQCSFVTSIFGPKVECAPTHAPIPTVPVALPTNCTIAKEPQTVTCSTASNQTEKDPLPNLPDGCSYRLVANQYYVECVASGN